MGYWIVNASYCNGYHNIIFRHPKRALEHHHNHQDGVTEATIGQILCCLGSNDTILEPFPELLTLKQPNGTLMEPLYQKSMFRLHTRHIKAAAEPPRTQAVIYKAFEKNLRRFLT